MWSAAGPIAAAERLQLTPKQVPRTTNHLESLNGRIKRKYFNPYLTSGRLPRADMYIMKLVQDVTPRILEEHRDRWQYERYKISLQVNFGHAYQTPPLGASPPDNPEVDHASDYNDSPDYRLSSPSLHSDDDDSALDQNSAEDADDTDHAFRVDASVAVPSGFVLRADGSQATALERADNSLPSPSPSPSPSPPVSWSFHLSPELPADQEVWDDSYEEEDAMLLDDLGFDISGLSPRSPEPPAALFLPPLEPSHPASLHQSLSYDDDDARAVPSPAAAPASVPSPAHANYEAIAHRELLVAEDAVAKALRRLLALGYTQDALAHHMSPAIQERLFHRPPSPLPEPGPAVVPTAGSSSAVLSSSPIPSQIPPELLEHAPLVLQPFSIQHKEKRKPSYNIR
ncbi:hypothetical protein PsYK624_153960 [Phanerochaete sordida]|uniref:Uncharacterized protein n=1 Tax=Phanerochaete sordida TaxID=48140 RepID=A0A9P3GRR3_9APHY|nr:hypothetical protein PsYK624_153960 [Phanerochaete sordida]